MSKETILLGGGSLREFVRVMEIREHVHLKEIERRVRENIEK